MVSSTIPLDKKTHNTTTFNPASLSTTSSSSTTTTILLKPSISGIDELESPLNSLNEQISILFPKCKPKCDQNANPMKSSNKITSSSSAVSYNLSQSDTSSSTLTNNLEPVSTAVAGGGGNIINNIKNKSPAQHRQDEEEEIISNYIETNPFRVGQSGGSGAVTNITTNATSTFNSATLGNSLFGGDKYYYSQHNRSHFNHNIFEKGDTYIPTNDKKTFKNHQQHDTNIQYVWEPHNVTASPSITPTTNLQKSDIFSSHNQLLKSPMEENQHHTDLKYFDFLHHDDKSNRDIIFSSEKNKYTSNGGGIGNSNAFDERFDDDDDGDNMNEPSFKQQSRRMNYDEPDYATVDLKKKSDDRVKTNGLTAGSNIMEYEGSPRRFGLQLNTDEANMYTSANLKLNLTSPTVYSPPRPGFPQRVIMEENPPVTPPHEETSIQIEDDTLNDCSEIGNNPSEYSIIDSKMFSNTATTTFDYLYEFSETRKVLEEFFKCPSNDDDKTLEKLSDFNDGASDDVESIDVHYDYHRNRLESENDNSYIGQKLAQLDTKDDEYDDHNDDHHEHNHVHNNHTIKINDESVTSPINHQNGYGSHHDPEDLYENHNNFEMFLDSASRSSGEILDNETKNNLTRHHSKTFRYSPDTTDYDSNCGDLDSEISLRYIGSEFGIPTDLNGGGVGGNPNNFSRFYACMPVLEDGLSSGHASDTENNNSSAINLQQQQQMAACTINDNNHHVIEHKFLDVSNNSKYILNNTVNTTTFRRLSPTQQVQINKEYSTMYPDSGDVDSNDLLQDKNENESGVLTNGVQHGVELSNCRDNDYDALYTRTIYLDSIQSTPPPPAPVPHRTSSLAEPASSDVQAALKDIRTTLKRTKTLSTPYEKSISDKNESPISVSPVWIPRSRLDNDNEYPNNSETEAIMGKNLSADEDDPDTDLETDRLLGHQRLDDKGFYDDKQWSADRNKTRSSLLTTNITKVSPQVQKNKPNSLNSSSFRQGINSLLGNGTTTTTTNNIAISPQIENKTLITPTTVRSPSNSILNLPPPDHQSIKYSPSSNQLIDVGGGVSSPEHSEIVLQNKATEQPPQQMQQQQQQQQQQQMQLHDDSNDHNDSSNSDSNNLKKELEKKKKGKNKEVLIEGVLFRARYLGSTQLVCEGQPTKSTRMMQAEEAVSRIKSPDGDPQPSTEVDLFISTEKIMVLNTDLKEIMMDHALRTISYIADIGDLVVLMARRRFVQQDTPESNGGGGICNDSNTTNSQPAGTPTTTTPANVPGSTNKMNRTPKMICHVFESEEAQFIAQSIGQAFQVAYMEFLKANGIEDHSFMKEMDYQEVLNSQEIFGDELEIFAKKELQKEVVVPKAKGEILGIVIVESGWGSMLPTVVIANLASTGAAARCGQLNIGDQIIAINGLSLVGLPLSTCQTYIKNTKNQTVVKFTVVPCAPVVEVKIKRPNTKYQLGFSVQNGVICSLLRGGIAERGGVRVGHRIIEINNQSVVAVPHEKIVNLLATSVGEILMKTMPTSMFRLLTGQENPIYI